MNENTTDDIQSVQGTTPDLQTEFAKKLSELAPELLADGKIDSKKLKELLDGDEADDSERFGLFWPGKKRAMRAAQEPTSATLKPAKDESKDWGTTQNLFIEGDNFEVLKVLQKHYHNKIKMIYIDPPYNTGKDFVYPDNFKEGLQNYLEFSKQVDEGNKKISTNTETDGRYHSNWLNMMYPRLKLARNLLTNDGMIFISIDDNEIAQLRKLCDEIFGEGNFIAQLIWQKIHSTKNDAKYFSDNHEYILCYARRIDDAKINLLDRSEAMNARYQNPDNDPRGPWQSGDLVANEPRKDGNYEVASPNGKIFTVASNKHWVYSRESMNKLISDNRIWFGVSGDSFPRKKRFLSEVLQGKKPDTLMLNNEVGHNQEGKRELLALFDGVSVFDTPKPVRLMKRLVELATKDSQDAIVLDFFSGTAATAHAVMQLNAEDGGNRKHIQVQLPEPADEKSEAYKAGYRKISDISKERIRRAGEKIKTDLANKLAERGTMFDVGFKVFKLSESNFTKWQSQSDTDKGSLQQHLLDIRESSNDAATEEDLLTEVLLKQGISLTAPIFHADVAGLSVWTVGDNLVCAYLNEKQRPNLDQLRAIAANEPAKLIVLEDAFQGDDELKTNLHQICKSQKIELWTV